MPKTFVIWAGVLMLCVAAHSQPNYPQRHSKNPSLKHLNLQPYQLTGVQKREIIARYNPFLKHYALSRSMRAFLNSKSRRKRATSDRNSQKIAKADLEKLEKIIRQLAEHMKRELHSKEPTRKDMLFQSKKVRRRNYDYGIQKPDAKIIDKKDLLNMIKTIVQENYPMSTKTPTEDNFSDLRRDLATIPDLKRSLEQLSSENTFDKVKLEPLPANPLLSFEYSITTDDFLESRAVTSSTVGSTDSADARAARNEEKPVGDHETIDRIYEDVETIKKQKSGGGGARNAFPCNVAGCWTSQMGGKVLQISQAANNVLYINTTNAMPLKEGFLMNPTWKLCGTNPFPNTGLVLVTAINEPCRQVAAFIGECKFCDGREVIQGQWLIGKLAKDCSDVIASQDVVGDVWKKEVSHELRKRRLKLP